MAAVDSLKPARIAGCGGLNSRDDAMLAGERGADYVMFGEPEADGRRPSFEAIVERIEWWAELFTVPCVGFAAAIARDRPAGRRRRRFRRGRRRHLGRSARRRGGARRGGAAARSAGDGGMNGSRHRCRASDRGARRPGRGTAADRPRRNRRHAAAASAGEPDLAYAEYQRGHYVAAFKEATRRVEEKSDPKAMTLLGELYADGLGVPNDDKKAAEWYKLAAARGDREAMFALAMFKMTGRGGPADRAGGGAAPGRGRQARPCRRAPTTSRCSISKARSCRRISPAPPN